MQWVSNLYSAAWNFFYPIPALAPTFYQEPEEIDLFPSSELRRRDIHQINQTNNLIWHGVARVFFQVFGMADPLRGPSLDDTHSFDLISAENITLLPTSKASLFLSPPISSIGIGWVTYYSGEHIYLLLGSKNFPQFSQFPREDHDIRESWSPCEGKYDADRHRHIAGTILEKIWKDTRGAYRFTEDDLFLPQIKCHTFISHARQKTALNISCIQTKSIVVFPITLSDFKSETDLEDISHPNLPQDFLEKNSFLWARLDHVFFSQLANVSPEAFTYDDLYISTHGLNGKLSPLLLHSSFIEDLSQPEMQEIIGKMRQ